jgi:hypothetical protein
MDLNYHQILAEVYEENAKNLLVDQNEYSDEEKEAYEDYDYEANDLPNKDEFNKPQGNHNKPEHVIIPDAKEHIKHKKPEVRTIVLNIDGAFRGNIVPTTTEPNCSGVTFQVPATNSTNFIFSAHKLYRNITSVKLTSMEFANTFYTFSDARGNTTFSITVGATTYPIRIREGNYTPSTLGAEIAGQIVSVPGMVSFTYDIPTHTFRFVGAVGSIITFPTSTSNPYGNGIGYNLGYKSTSYTLPGGTFIDSDVTPDLIQDTYVYLQINDWNLLEHQQYGQTFFSVFAKIQLTGAKNNIVFDNNFTNSSTKEYVFPQPVNLQRFEIRMLDAYGNTLDLRNGSFSMTIELQQVDSSAVYEDLIKTL